MCLQPNKDRVNLGRKSEELHFFFLKTKKNYAWQSWRNSLLKKNKQASKQKRLYNDATKFLSCGWFLTGELFSLSWVLSTKEGVWFFGTAFPLDKAISSCIY